MNMCVTGLAMFREPGFGNAFGRASLYPNRFGLNIIYTNLA